MGIWGVLLWGAMREPRMDTLVSAPEHTDAFPGCGAGIENSGRTCRRGRQFSKGVEPFHTEHLPRFFFLYFLL